jgi:hypothetical protein
MARFAVQHRARSVKALQAFDADGYAWCARPRHAAAAGVQARGTHAASLSATG